MPGGLTPRRPPEFRVLSETARYASTARRDAHGSEIPQRWQLVRGVPSSDALKRRSRTLYPFTARSLRERGMRSEV
jgi:hypothetical protein